jgi:hypothetical protein
MANLYSLSSERERLQDCGIDLGDILTKEEQAYMESFDMDTEMLTDEDSRGGMFNSKPFADLCPEPMRSLHKKLLATLHKAEAEAKQ